MRFRVIHLKLLSVCLTLVSGTAGAEICTVGLSIESNSSKLFGSYKLSEVKHVRDEILAQKGIQFDEYPKSYPDMHVDYALRLKVDADQGTAFGTLETRHFVSNSGKPSDGEGNAINERVLAPSPKQCRGCDLEKLLAETLRQLPTCAEIKTHKLNHHGPVIFGIGADVQWADEYLSTPEKREAYAKVMEQFVSRAFHQYDANFKQTKKSFDTYQAEFERKKAGLETAIRDEPEFRPQHLKQLDELLADFEQKKAGYERFMETDIYNRDLWLEETCRSAGEFAARYAHCHRFIKEKTGTTGFSQSSASSAK